MTTVVLNTVTRKVEVFSSARDVHARAEIADHRAAANPHPQYLADADLAEVALSGDAGDLTAGTLPDARMPNWTGYNLSSRTALESANVPAVVGGLRLLGHAAVGDGGGAHYKRVASEPAHPHKIQSADGAWWEELFAEDVTVRIPSDFATLQDAVDRLSKQPVRRGARIIINIESGHALTAGLSLEDGDYGRFTITSTDAEVALDAAFPTTDAVLRAVNARGPVWNILVDCNNQDVGSSNEVAAAIFLRDCSTLKMGSGSGAKNVGGAGIFVGYSSKVQCPGGPIFSGCSGHAAFVTGSSDAMLNDADFTNCTHADAAVYVSRLARLSAVGANFSDATGGGLLVRRSYAMVTSGSSNTLFDNCGGIAIEAAQGSTVVANERNSLPVLISNCNAGVLATEGSTVDVRECQITNVTTYGLRATVSSRIVAYNVICNGVGGDAVIAERASQVDAGGLDAFSVTGQGILCSGSSVVNATGADVSSASGNDVEVSEGGIVTFASGTGTVSQPVNSPTGAGIIFDPGTAKSGTWTPYVEFATGGDQSITYTRQNGVWWREGNLLWFAFEVAWEHTHSTSSGPLRIRGVPHSPAAFSPAIHAGIVFSRIGRVVFDADDKQLLAQATGGTDRLDLQVARSGTVLVPADETYFPSGGGEFLLGGHGSYRTA